MFTANVPIKIENLTCENIKVHCIEKHTEGNFERWIGSMARGDTQFINSTSLALPVYFTVAIPSLDMTCEEPVTIIPTNIKDNEEEIHDISFINSSRTKKLLLNAAVKRVSLTEPLVIVLYSQYWLFDLTKLDLSMSIDKDYYYLIRMVEDK